MATTITINGQEYIIEQGAGGYSYYRVSSTSRFGKKVKAKDGFVAVWNSTTGTPNPDIGLNTVAWGNGADVPPPVVDPIGWDVASMSYDGISAPTAPNTSPNGIDFNLDGTLMYLVDANANDLRQYTLSSGWDLSTVSYDTTVNITNVQNDLVFAKDGSRFCIVNNSLDRIYQYILNTPWDLNGGIATNNSIYLASKDTVLTSMAYSTDGTKLFFYGLQYKTIFRASLSTPWDITTYTMDVGNTFDASAQMSNSQSEMHFSSDGTQLLLFNSSTDLWHQYTLSTPWDLTTVTYDNVTFEVDEDPSMGGAAFKHDGTKMYQIGSNGDMVHQYTSGYQP
jgi:hypothetical protein